MHNFELVGPNGKVRMFTTEEFVGTKTFTVYSARDDMMAPGKKVKVREVIRVLDKDKHVFEWFETRDGKESKTMEITYTRKK